MHVEQDFRELGNSVSAWSWLVRPSRLNPTAWSSDPFFRRRGVGFHLRAVDQERAGASIQRR